MAEFLLELVSEEIPPSEQEPAAAHCAKACAELFAKAGADKARLIQQFSTPKRIGVCFENVPLQRPAFSEERRGPRENAPEAAISGFKRSVLGAEVFLRQGYYFAQIKHQEIEMRDLLFKELPDLLRNFRFGKSMRWLENDDFRWVRPLRRILCLLDGKPVPFKIAGLTASNLTEGRLIHSWADYTKLMERKNIIINPEARQERIIEQIDEKIEEAGEKGIDHEAFDLTITAKAMAGVSEQPVILCYNGSDGVDIGGPKLIIAGSLLPEKVRLAVFTKEFAIPLFRAEGKIWFKDYLLLADGTENDEKIVKRNFNQLLKARLDDAVFFIEKDVQTGMNNLRQQLKNISFHAQLGTMLDRADRIEQLACGKTLPGDNHDDDIIRKAAHHAKNDIASVTAKEFPQALGEIGSRLFFYNFIAPLGDEQSYSALNLEQSWKIIRAIDTHYIPLRHSDDLPSKEGQIIALADRADMLAGFFAIGEMPTGSSDPYALRRAAIGMVRIILESTDNNFQQFDLLKLFSEALDLYETQIKIQDKQAIKKKLQHFILQRLKYHLRNLYQQQIKIQDKPAIRQKLQRIWQYLKYYLRKTYRPDPIQAAMDVPMAELNLKQIAMRLDALQSFLNSKNNKNLMVAWQRISGILKNQKATTKFDPKYLIEDAEKKLFQEFEKISPKYQIALEQNNFTEAFGLLATLRHPIDNFFEQVRVEVQEPQLKQNRYGLCSKLRDMMALAADFSKIY